uniref:ORF2 n=1 Tax=Taro bacilliform virus TaxID=178354 RepID=A0A384ZCC5_9VIRU|nr:ORF2 [Taro bacilliform virus]
MSTNPDYTKALEETKSLGDPAVGFYEVPTTVGTTTGLSAILKQNNAIIHLLLSLHEKVDKLSSKASVDDLASKLSKLSIKESPVVKTKTPLFVYKSPRLILEEERHKIGLKPTTDDWAWPTGHPYAPKQKSDPSSSK